MIQVKEEAKDRGRQLFDAFPQAITNMAKSRKQGYYQSKVYSGLKNRVKLNDDMIDGLFRNTQTFISDIYPPIIRKAYLEFKAIFGKFLEQDPLFSVGVDNNTPEEQSVAIQTIISDNLKKTYYRDKCLYWDIDMAVRYGTYANYSFATSDFNAGSLLTIQDNENGMGDYKQVIGEGENCVVTIPIHPLNVFVDPRSNWMVSPDFLGFIGDITVANLSVLKQNEAYIIKNLKEIIQKAKGGLSDEFWHGGQGSSELKDFSKAHANISYMWTRLPFEENEDDATWYYIEMVADTIIRIEANTLDHNTIPLALGYLIPRPYSWCGNSPLESKICIQNMMNWLINTEIESTMKLMDRIVLYRPGLDVDAINSRHKTGGFIPYSGQEPDLSKLIFSPQFQDSSRQNVDWLVREMRQEDQETSPIVNLQNKYNQGGMNNTTLGAAQMTQSIGEMLTSDMVQSFVAGQKQTAKHQLVLLRAVSGDSLKAGGKEYKKAVLLGNVEFTVKTSNVYNYAQDLLNANNSLTQIINFRATQIPEFQAIKLGPVIKNYVRASQKRENIDELVDSNMLTAIERQNQQKVAQMLAPKPPAPPQGTTGPAVPPQGGTQ